MAIQPVPFDTTHATSSATPPGNGSVAVPLEVGDRKADEVKDRRDTSVASSTSSVDYTASGAPPASENFRQHVTPQVNETVAANARGALAQDGSPIQIGARVALNTQGITNVGGGGAAKG